MVGPTRRRERESVLSKLNKKLATVFVEDRQIFTRRKFPLHGCSHKLHRVRREEKKIFSRTREAKEGEAGFEAPPNGVAPHRTFPQL